MGNRNSGRAGLPHTLVRRAERLIRAGLSYSEIARRLDIDRETVPRIAEGMHPRQRQFTRCNGCGGMVEAPCAVCRLRGGP